MMNQSLLHHLQSVKVFPCITLLHTTVPGARMVLDDLRGLLRLADEAEERLAGHVSDELLEHLTRRTEQLIAQAADDMASEAIAICVSPGFDAVVRLGVPLRSRCVVDDTFATRDMVVESKRTAVFRLFSVSEQRVRKFIGDRNRLIEERSDGWPIERAEDQSDRNWSRIVTDALLLEQDADPLPTVLAGVERTTRQLVASSRVSYIAQILGNHDRTGWATLHSLAWPLVDRWLRSDREDALRRLDLARSNRRFAGGLEEVWELAREGRVELLVVEQQFEVPARVAAGYLERSDDPRAHDVIDDAVDDLIEMVLRAGGDTVTVPEGDLAEHGHLAAVLRY